MERIVSPLKYQLEMGESNIQHFMVGSSEMFEVFQDIESLFFRNFLNSKLAADQVNEVSYRLFGRSLSLWQASIRVTAAGQAYAFAPLIRVVIEYACYASFMESKRDLIEVWLKRNESRTAKNRFKDKFKNIIKRSCDHLDSAIDGLGASIYKTYEESIADGAHPNPFALTSSPMIAVQGSDVRVFSRETDNYSLSALETNKAFLRALDVGLFLVTVANNSYRHIQALPLDELRRIRDYVVDFGNRINNKIAADTEALPELIESLRGRQAPDSTS